MKMWIPGTPVTFATRGERAWKEVLKKSIQPVDENEYTGMYLEFILPTMASSGHYLDIDNLCEPVFSILVNALYWFNGKRTNIQWWTAEKRIGQETGLSIQFFTTKNEEFLLQYGYPVFHATYLDKLPLKATDPNMLAWFNTFPGVKSLNGKIAVELQFQLESINLGDICTGKIKPVIDNPYPLVGGKPSNPDDWRIDRLYVNKSKNRTGQSLIIKVWEMK